MKIRTRNLIGDPLDWAILTLHGWKDLRPNPHRFDQRLIMSDDRGDCQFLEDMAVSTSGDFVIDIMEREGINSRALRRDGHPMNGLWLAAYDHGNTGSMVQWVRREDWPRHYLSGPTLRVAVCRCFVAAKLGDKVEVPDELVKEKWDEHFGREDD